MRTLISRLLPRLPVSNTVPPYPISPPTDSNMRALSEELRRRHRARAYAYVSALCERCCSTHRVARCVRPTPRLPRPAPVTARRPHDSFRIPNAALRTVLWQLPDLHPVP